MGSSPIMSTGVIMRLKRDHSIPERELVMEKKEAIRRDFVGRFLEKIRNEDEQAYQQAHNKDINETQTKTEKKEESDV